MDWQFGLSFQIILAFWRDHEVIPLSDVPLPVQRDILHIWTASPSGTSAGFAACLHSSDSIGT